MEGKRSSPRQRLICQPIVVVKTKVSIVCLLTLLASLLAFTSGYGQLSKDLVIYPFVESSRSDSLQVVTQRIGSLVKARTFFEKTYLNKTLVFVPVSARYRSLFERQPYLLLADVPRKKKMKADFQDAYRRVDRQLNQAIEKKNKEIQAASQPGQGQAMTSLAAQSQVMSLAKRPDYELLFAVEGSFMHYDTLDPRQNRLADSLQRTIEQIVLGRPHTISGYVNSINYQATDFSQVAMPELIEVLLQQNLALCKRMIVHPPYARLVKDARLSYKEFSGPTKLWVTSSVAQQVVYLSPYLIRAVFNMSLYQRSLYPLAEVNGQTNESLRTFLEGKESASVREINERYFNHFVEVFSRNISFVIGHELAHMYLADQPLRMNLETACDLNAAYFYLRHTGQLDLGVFENLLMQSLSSQELDFWGHDIDKQGLTSRYRQLKALTQTKDVGGLKGQLHWPAD
ncbi:hypothetical protein ACFQ4C_08460 [Larkinella insperata]|uniref:Peptidase M48 domain-containing protein n=1 Tax=Larkinella insperata TaxID=332158 RepID=A0ABW3Q2L4_9BACT